jgi:hypothetical protein
MDKRFWSGAVIVVTVAVAGAGALPTLLLRPSAEPAPLEATFAAAAIVSKPEPKAAPAVASPPAPVAVVPPPAPPPAVASPPSPIVVSAPAALQAPTKPEPAVVLPPVAAPPPAAIVPAPEPAREAKSEPFPPVQPVGVAAHSEAKLGASGPIEKPRSMRAKRAARKWVRLARFRAANAAKRNGSVRPATYPIREFLAWRR